ncbi:MAG: alpha/beta hydrolase [Acidobacteria bacterium]|nr:alpha/beta hydrolase [Acidobacteriota bacterium]
MRSVGGRRLFFSVARIAAIVYLTLCLMLRLFQADLIYFPVKEVSATPRQAGLDFESVTLLTDDNLKLAAWWIPAPNARAAILFCHGNAGNIGHRLESLQIFYRLGLSTLIFDYRGYGESEGNPSEQGTYLDAEAAWQHLVEQRGAEPDRVVFFGRSLGGAVAIWLATRHPPAGLIIESTFTSIVDMGAAQYPYLPVRWLARFHYNSLETIPRVRSPVLVVHSRQDEMIPFRHGQSLFQAANEPKAFLEISGDHNGGFLTSGPVYQEGLRSFLDAHLP